MLKNIIVTLFLTGCVMSCLAQNADNQKVEFFGPGVQHYMKGTSRVDSIIGFTPKKDVAISEDKYAYIEMFDNHIYSVTVATHYKDGVSSSDLNVKKVNLEGEIIWAYKDTTHLSYAHKDIYVSKEGVFVMYEGYFGQLKRHCHLDKFNHDGKREWTIDFGNKYGTQIGNMINQLPDGNLVVCTSHYEPSFFHKISQAGKVLLQYRYTEKKELTIEDFDIDEAGNIYAIGEATSYPDRQYTNELYLLKLNSNLQVLNKKVLAFGQVTIASSIKYLGNGQCAVGFSADIDHNREDRSKEYHIHYGLLNEDLELSNLSSYWSNGVEPRHSFHRAKSGGVIAYNGIYWKKKSYKLLLHFDENMEYQRVDMLDFSTGIGEVAFLENGDLLAIKPVQEAMLIIDSFD